MVPLVAAFRAIAPAYVPLLGALSTLAIAITPGQTQVSPPDCPDAHFLWKVESPNNTVYLLGSIHMLDASAYPLPDPMESAFAAAEVVVFETDLSPEAMMDAALDMMMVASAEPDVTLADSLDAETYQLAEQRAADLGFPIDLFQPFKPWFLAVNLTVIHLMSLGFTPEQGIDQHFYSRAEAAEKDILFLETPADQLGLFEQLSAEEQQQFVRQSLEEMDLLEESFDHLRHIWSTGDVAAMEAFLLASFADYPQMQQIFLSDRNRTWLPQIESFLETEEDHLVVVGALHLVGPDNVLSLLEQAGHRAEQL